MKQLVLEIYHFFARFGGFGLIGLGALDSSILFMPLGNDLLLVALSAHDPERVPFYVAMATLGSVLGCLFTDVVSRKGGEAGLERRVSKRRLNYVVKRVEKHAGKALAVAALMPPPFPFTPVVAAAAALKYPRKKLLGVLAAARAVRFTGEGLLAIFFGSRILSMAEHGAVQGFVLFILAVSVIGSVVSLVTWIRRSRTHSDRVPARAG